MNYLVTQRNQLRIIKIEKKRIKRNNGKMKTNDRVSFMKNFSQKRSKKYKKKF